MFIRFKFRTIPCVAIFLLVSFAGFSQTNASKPAAGHEEIRKTEKQFETDLNNLGAAVAFEKYAAPNAVIKRQNDSLIYGPKAIRLYFPAITTKRQKRTGAPIISISHRMARWPIPMESIIGK